MLTQRRNPVHDFKLLKVKQRRDVQEMPAAELQKFAYGLFEVKRN